MNNKAIVSATTAMCLAASGLSFAQGRGNDRGRGEGQRGEPQDRRDNDGR